MTATNLHPEKRNPRGLVQSSTNISGCISLRTFSVDNPVHNRFLVTQTSPAINRFRSSAAFLTTEVSGRKLKS
jgi:hypothetical protein